MGFRPCAITFSAGSLALAQENHERGKSTGQELNTSTVSCQGVLYTLTTPTVFKQRLTDRVFDFQMRAFQQISFRMWRLGFL